MIEYRFRVPSATVFTLYSYSKALEYRFRVPTAGSVSEWYSCRLAQRTVDFGCTKLIITAGPTRQWRSGAKSEWAELVLSHLLCTACTAGPRKREPTATGPIRARDSPAALHEDGELAGPADRCCPYCESATRDGHVGGHRQSATAPPAGTPSRPPRPACAARCVWCDVCAGRWLPTAVVL
jgi:hypothetical protein